MEQLSVCDEIVAGPPPRRQGKTRALGVHAVQFITRGAARVSLQFHNNDEDVDRLFATLP